MVLGDVGGFAEFARAYDAARLVPPGDAEALAAALNDLIADPAKRAELSAAARAAVEKAHGWDAIAASTLALYERLGRPARLRQPIIGPRCQWPRRSSGAPSRAWSTRM